MYIYIFIYIRNGDTLKTADECLLLIINGWQNDFLVRRDVDGDVAGDVQAEKNVIRGKCRRNFKCKYRQLKLLATFRFLVFRFF